MKKLLITLAVISFLFSLSACEQGEQYLTEPSSGLETTAATDPVAVTQDTVFVPDEDLSYAEGYAFWGEKVLDAPQVPPLEWQTVTITEGITRDLATTPFHFDINSIYSSLCENAYLQKNYNAPYINHTENIYFRDSFGTRVFAQSENVIIKAPAGSAAEAYAMDNELSFEEK